MLVLLINALILLSGVSISVIALFWKHFANKPSESLRATIATIAGMVGLAIFFSQTYIMTFELGQNLVTILGTWLSS